MKNLILFAFLIVSSINAKSQLSDNASSNYRLGYSMGVQLNTIMNGLSNSATNTSSQQQASQILQQYAIDYASLINDFDSQALADAFSNGFQAGLSRTVSFVTVTAKSVSGGGVSDSHLYDLLGFNEWIVIYSTTYDIMDITIGLE